MNVIRVPRLLAALSLGLLLVNPLVSAQEAVDNVVIVRAEPYHTFGPGLLLPFRQARFVPARKGGVAVNSQMLIEVRYGPSATTARRGRRAQ